MTIAGVKYKLGMFIVVNVDEPEKEFGEIKKIIKKDDTVEFEVLIFNELYFDKHYYAYVVKRSAELRQLKLSNLLKYPSCICNNTESASFITVKYRL